MTAIMDTAKTGDPQARRANYGLTQLRNNDGMNFCRLHLQGTANCNGKLFAVRDGERKTYACECCLAQLAFKKEQQ